MKIFNKLFGFSAASEDDNETFVNLIRTAMEDEEIRRKLVSILSLDPFQRKSAIGSLVEDMKYRGAPGDFIEAVAFLRDDNVARKALKILTDGKYPGNP